MLTTGLISTLRNRDKEEIKSCVNLALASSLQDLVETRNKIEEPKNYPGKGLPYKTTKLICKHEKIYESYRTLKR